ncbi:hypothetical protein [Pseudomonas sp. URIL14HWK12:I5]|uniref:hypothetical protein n=1 Tax=Pseudomonas sp. URIL14HWK12:I5 TaxID=1261630 RepID=UPI0009D89429|nr:DNA polymerase V [Pseudomonas sp. URIL14HWK12:I5]
MNASLILRACRGSLTQFGRDVRAKVLRCADILVGVGIARTKTLTKLANQKEERLQAHTGWVVDITDDFNRDWVLRNTSLAAQWGINGASRALFCAPLWPLTFLD